MQPLLHTVTWPLLSGHFPVIAKHSVENWDGLLDNMASALRHHLIKAQSPNLHVNYGSSRQWVMCITCKIGLYYWDSSTNKPHRSEVDIFNQQHLQSGPPVLSPVSFPVWFLPCQQTSLMLHWFCSYSSSCSREKVPKLLIHISCQVPAPGLDPNPTPSHHPPPPLPPTPPLPTVNKLYS